MPLIPAFGKGCALIPALRKQTQAALKARIVYIESSRSVRPKTKQKLRKYMKRRDGTCRKTEFMSITPKQHPFLPVDCDRYSRRKIGY